MILPVFDAGAGIRALGVARNGRPVKLATLDAKPGISVYPF